MKGEMCTVKDRFHLCAKQNGDMANVMIRNGYMRYAVINC